MRRYFISHQKAGELCVLSCGLGENRDVFFPNLAQGLDEKTLPDIACDLLVELGYQPVECASEEEARGGGAEAAPISNLPSIISTPHPISNLQSPRPIRSPPSTPSRPCSSRPRNPGLSDFILSGSGPSGFCFLLSAFCFPAFEGGSLADSVFVRVYPWFSSFRTAGRSSSTTDGHGWARIHRVGCHRRNSPGGCVS